MIQPVLNPIHTPYGQEGTICAFALRLLPKLWRSVTFRWPNTHPEYRASDYSRYECVPANKELILWSQPTLSFISVRIETKFPGSCFHSLCFSSTRTEENPSCHVRMTEYSFETSEVEFTPVVLERSEQRIDSVVKSCSGFCSSCPQTTFLLHRSLPLSSEHEDTAKHT